LIFIDTGAFLSRFIVNDTYHKKSLNLWKKIESKKIICYTSNFIIDELATLLLRRTGADFCYDKINRIYESPQFNILRPTKENEFNALELLKKYSDQEISFTDCISFDIIKSNRIPKAFTFDKHFSYMGIAIFE
jgi:uncharacterized protein